MKKYWSIFILLLVVGSARTQPLDTLVAAAYRNNLELRALYGEYLAALERGDQVNQLPDPELGLGIFVLPVETRLGPQWVRLGVTQLFPWVGTLKAREDLAVAVARSRYQRTEELRQELAYRVKEAYYQLYELESSQAIIRNNLRLFRSLEQLALAGLESGTGSGADVLRAQLRIQEQEQELAILENREAKPLATLNQLLNRPLNTPVAVADTLTMATLALDRDTLSAFVAANHPAIRRLGLEQEVARREIEVNDRERGPTFGIGLDYIITGKRSDAEPLRNGRDALLPRASIRIPLFTDKYAAKEREETLRIEALDHRKEELRSRYLAAVERAYADFREVQLQMALYRRQLRTIEGAVNILTTRYSAEGRGFDELLRLRLDQAGYERKLLEAVVQSHLVKAEIERLVEY